MAVAAVHQLAQHPLVQHLLVQRGLGRQLAARFVAGEQLDEALAVVRALNQRGLRASLNYLGEYAASPADQQAAAAQYVAILDAIHQAGVDANISIKLTQLGLAQDEERCRELTAHVLRRARELGVFVRFDMEHSAVVEATLRTFAALYPDYPNCGVVLQAYLYRSAADLERLIALGARVRLCKGAYREPPAVAFPRKADVDANFVRLMERLLLAGHYPALATHDERLIRHAKHFAFHHRVAPARFEFQMLYGVRRDLQLRLVREGYNVRVYVPFGEQWYPYLMRRLAERPANLVFLLSNLAREAGAA